MGKKIITSLFMLLLPLGAFAQDLQAAALDDQVTLEDEAQAQKPEPNDFEPLPTVAALEGNDSVVERVRAKFAAARKHKDKGRQPAPAPNPAPQPTKSLVTTGNTLPTPMPGELLSARQPQANLACPDPGIAIQTQATPDSKPQRRRGRSFGKQLLRGLGKVAKVAGGAVVVIAAAGAASDAEKSAAPRQPAPQPVYVAPPPSANVYSAPQPIQPVTSWDKSPANWKNNPGNWENNPANWKNNSANWKNNPANWKNSSANWENNQANWKNNAKNWKNDPANWENNPANWKNNPNNQARRDFIDSNGRTIGYVVPQEDGGLNVFSNEGKRMLYTTPSSNGLFNEKGENVGHLVPKKTGGSNAFFRGN